MTGLDVPRTGGAQRATRLLRAGLPIAATGVLLLAVPVVVGDSRTYMGVAIAVVFTALHALGFNLVFGLTRQLFLCVGALAAVGGYGTTLLAGRAGLPVPVAGVSAVLLAALLGGLFSWIAVRRSLDTVFTGIVTLAFALGLEALLLALRDLTGGEDGLAVPVARTALLRDPVGGYLVAVGALLACLALFQWLQHSHHGWAFRAVREDPLAAALAGVDVPRQRVLAGALAAGVLGLAGTLTALHEGRVSPSTFAFTDVDVGALLALALGGIGSLLGPVVGAVVLGLLDEVLLRELGTLRIAVEGVVLVVLFLTLRQGLTGALRRGTQTPSTGPPTPPRGQRRARSQAS